MLTAALDVSGEIFRGWCPAVFPLLHAGRDTTEADTHRRFLRGCIFGPGCKSRRLHLLLRSVGPLSIPHLAARSGSPSATALRPSLAAAGAADSPTKSLSTSSQHDRLCSRHSFHSLDHSARVCPVSLLDSPTKPSQLHPSTLRLCGLGLFHALGLLTPLGGAPFDSPPRCALGVAFGDCPPALACGRRRC